jgi:hypothetical protein
MSYQTTAPPGFRTRVISLAIQRALSGASTELGGPVALAQYGRSPPSQGLRSEPAHSCQLMPIPTANVEHLASAQVREAKILKQWLHDQHLDGEDGQAGQGP